MDPAEPLLPPASPDHSTRQGGATMPGSIMGTVGYMSPEQAKGFAVTAASDVFSLGCVLYEMLSGAGPFRGETTAESLAKIIRDEPAPLVRRVCPKDLEPILLKALCKDASQRYSSGDEFHGALRSMQELASGKRAEAPLLGLVKGSFVSLTDSLLGRWSHRESRKEWAREKPSPRLWL